MERFIRRVWVWGLFGCISLVGSGNAQGGSPPGIQANPNRSDAITTGTVIAYGVPIPMPYVVHTSGDAILINGQAYLPRPVDPSRAAPEVVPDEISIQKHELLTRISRRYAELRNSAGSSAARQVIPEFTNDPLVQSLGYSDDELLVTFRDGNTEHVLLNTLLEDASTSPDEAAIEQQNLATVEVLRDLLSRGGAIAFGHDYTLLIPQPDAGAVLQTILAIASSQLNSDAGHQQLVRITSSEALSEDVISHINTWR